MAYQLIGSVRSPFVRVCRMFMIQNSIPFEFRVLNFVDSAEDAAALARETPVNKVPILVEDGVKIFDSRVIMNRLARKHGIAPLSVDDENRVSTIYSALDAGVILFLMKRDGFDLSGNGFFVARQRARIPAALEYVREWARRLDPAKPEDWNYASMSLYAFLVWAEARQLLKASDFAEMPEFLERFKNAPGVKETSF